MPKQKARHKWLTDAKIKRAIGLWVEQISLAELERFCQACSKAAEINLTRGVTSKKLAQNCQKIIDYI